MSRSNGSKAAKAPEPSQLEAVRDLLFGETARSIEDRLEDVSGDFKARIAALEERLVSAIEREQEAREADVSDLRRELAAQKKDWNAQLKQVVKQFEIEVTELDQKKANRHAVADALEQVATSLRGKPASKKA